MRRRQGASVALWCGVELALLGPVRAKRPRTRRKGTDPSPHTTLLELKSMTCWQDGRWRNGCKVVKLSDLLQRGNRRCSWDVDRFVEVLDVLQVEAAKSCSKTSRQALSWDVLTERSPRGWTVRVGSSDLSSAER